MEKRRAVSTLGRKVRRMTRPKAVHVNHRGHGNTEIPPIAIGAPIDIVPMESDDAVVFEAQKCALKTKLKLLTEEYAVEEEKRKTLQERATLVRSKASGAFAKTPENETLRLAHQTIQEKLENVVSEYKGHRDSVVQMRSKLDEMRSVRCDMLNASPRLENLANTGPLDQFPSPDAFEDPQSGRRAKTSMAKVKHSTGNGNDVVRKVDELHELIGSILDMTKTRNVQELFKKAERLERKNARIHDHILQINAATSALRKEVGRIDKDRAMIEEGRDQIDKSQKRELASLTERISDAQARLAEIESDVKADEPEYVSIYEEIGYLFSALGCSWADANETTVNAQNVVFALEAIESAVAELTKK